jgi:hypothetical protein
MGEYRFPNIPAGSYRVNAYDERATDGQRRQMPVSMVDAERKVLAPLIRLAEARCAQAPHKSKFGLDYPPASDGPSYHGIRK